MRHLLTLVWAFWPVVVTIVVVSFVIYAFVYDHQAGHDLAERREQDFYRHYAECRGTGLLSAAECVDEAQLWAYIDNPGPEEYRR